MTDKRFIALAGPTGPTVPTVPTVSSLVRAAVGLDVEAVADTVRAALTDRGVPWTWERLIQPVWDALGGGGDAVAERLFSRAVSGVLAAASRPSPRAPARVLLAGTAAEDRTLPIDALAAALAESGVGACVLGGRVPPRAVAAAAGRLRPVVLVVWSQALDTADPRQISSALTARRGPTVIAAGPGWNAAALPAPAMTAAGVVVAQRATMALLAGGTRSAA